MDYLIIFFVVILFLVLIIFGLPKAKQSFNEQVQQLENTAVKENFTNSSSNEDVNKGAGTFYDWSGYPDTPDAEDCAVPKYRNCSGKDCLEDKNTYVENDFNIYPMVKETVIREKPDCSKCDVLSCANSDKYVLKSSVPPCPDMSKFALKSMLQPNIDMKDYIKKTEIPPCKACPDMSLYVRKSEIPACPPKVECPECPKCPKCPDCVTREFLSGEESKQKCPDCPKCPRCPEFPKVKDIIDRYKENHKCPECPVLPSPADIIKQYKEQNKDSLKCPSQEEIIAKYKKTNKCQNDKEFTKKINDYLKKYEDAVMKKLNELENMKKQYNKILAENNAKYKDVNSQCEERIGDERSRRQSDINKLEKNIRDEERRRMDERLIENEKKNRVKEEEIKKSFQRAKQEEIRRIRENQALDATPVPTTTPAPTTPGPERQVNNLSVSELQTMFKDLVQPVIRDKIAMKAQDVEERIFDRVAYQEEQARLNRHMENAQRAFILQEETLPPQPTPQYKMFSFDEQINFDQPTFKPKSLEPNNIGNSSQSYKVVPIHDQSIEPPMKPNCPPFKKN